MWRTMEKSRFETPRIAILKACWEQECNQATTMPSTIGVVIDENICVVHITEPIGTASLEQRTSSIDLRLMKKMTSDIITMNGTLSTSSPFRFMKIYCWQNRRVLVRNPKAQFYFHRQIAAICVAMWFNEKPPIRSGFSRGSYDFQRISIKSVKKSTRTRNENRLSR